MPRIEPWERALEVLASMGPSENGSAKKAKTKWFNQQYLMARTDAELAPLVRAEFAKAGHAIDPKRAATIAGLLKERVQLLPDFYAQGKYFVTAPDAYEEKPIRKKWKPERAAAFAEMADDLAGLADWSAPAIKATVLAFMERHELGFGAVLPILRVAVSGSVQGPDAFAILAAVGREESVARLRKGYAAFDAIKAG